MSVADLKGGDFELLIAPVLTHEDMYRSNLESLCLFLM